MKAVHGAGKIGFVGAGAIVASAARAHRETERHGLETARLVTGQFQTFDMHGPMDAALADFFGGPFRPLGEQSAKAVALRYGRNGAEKSVGSAEGKIQLARPGQQSPFGTFHSPGQGAAGADGIQSVEI